MKSLSKDRLQNYLIFCFHSTHLRGFGNKFLPFRVFRSSYYVTIPNVPVILGIGVLLLGLVACNPDNSVDTKDVAIKVNNAVVSTEEFNEMIKLEVYADPEMSLSDENRKRYVEYLISKELMIQEAMRLKLDRNKNFIKTIETYWEATLIRKLLDSKTAELKKEILVTEDEIKAYYTANKDEFGEPYEEFKETIKSILESRHLKERLDAWTLSLRDSADITINQNLKGKPLKASKRELRE